MIYPYYWYNIGSDTRAIRIIILKVKLKKKKS